MRHWAVKLDEYGIDKQRYLELKAICQQYEKYKRAVAAMKRGEVDRRAGTGEYRKPDPTGNTAVSWASSREAARIAAIEQAAAAADPVICVYILKNVCRGTRYEEMPVPCGRRQFFALRRRFFVELDERLR